MIEDVAIEYATGVGSLRVGIDNISPGASTGSHAIGGMRDFLAGLATQLPARARHHLFELYTPSWHDPFPLTGHPNLRVVTCRGVPRHAAGRVMYEQTVLARQLSRRRPDVWLASCNTLPLAWRGRTVLIVQSLQYLGHPEAFSWLRRSYLRGVAVASLRRATRLVTFSNASKADIVERVGVPGEKITVIPHAVRFPPDLFQQPDDENALAQVRAATGGTEYVLSVSGFYPYKNLFRLIEAFARLKPGMPHKLVLAGAETSSVSRADLLAAGGRLGVAHDLVFMGRVSDEMLLTLYRHASAMAMPSLEETFGLPVLEAMAMGCPVITSNLSSMPEVAGSAAVLVDPVDVEGMAGGLHRILSDAALQRSLRAAGRQRAGEYTQDRFFAALLSVIGGAVG